MHCTSVMVYAWVSRHTIIVFSINTITTKLNSSYQCHISG
jgi:hypothetical protein